MSKTSLSLGHSSSPHHRLHFCRMASSSRHGLRLGLSLARSSVSGSATASSCLRSSPLRCHAARSIHTSASVTASRSIPTFFQPRPYALDHYLRAFHQRSHFSTSSANNNASSPPPPSSAPESPLRRHEYYTQKQRETYKRRNQSLAMYTIAVIIFGVGFTYASVPLYRAFCSATGFGGTPMVGQGRFEPSRLVPMDPHAKKIRVTFNADCSDELPWSFQRSQDEILVIPGETSLAFFTAKNRSKKDIIGIATYNVAPDRIAPYFSKVECFCFEQQKLLAGEEVDLPVFFFIDNDYLDDPNCKDVQDVVLSYTFFAARRNQVTGDLEPDTDLQKYQVGHDLPGVK
ncbi:unnamed protein product [Sympodiomycopsis kandeliae]